MEMIETNNLKSPLVSVIVLTFNLSGFVVETLESIKAQSYHNIELIVSDDGSTDESIQICRKWINENKLRFHRTDIITTPKNTGIPANCNRGLHASTGEWVKIIAGDDTLVESCITDNIDHIKNNPGIFVLFSYVDSYANTFSADTFLGREPKKLPADYINDTIDAREQYRILLLGDRVMFAGSAFINRHALLKVGGWDERYKIEDNPMWLKLTKNGYKLNFMEKVTFNYRRHENAITYLPNRNLVNHAYLWSEQFRKDNVYPFVEWQYRLDFQYKYKIALLVKIIFSNRSTRLSRWGYSFLLKWGNPFYYILLSGRIKKRIFGKQSPSPR